MRYFTFFLYAALVFALYFCIIKNFQGLIIWKSEFMSHIETFYLHTKVVRGTRTLEVCFMGLALRVPAKR